jgi:DNA-binding NtrC family response regulator
MNGDDASVLAYVPDSMKTQMGELNLLATRALTVCDRPEDLARLAKKSSYSVVLLPSDLPTHQWLSTWALIITLEPRPSILVYARESDFSMWSGLLEAGAFDVIVAPFTRLKLLEAIESAVREFRARSPEDSAEG